MLYIHAQQQVNKTISSFTYILHHRFYSMKEHLKCSQDIHM